MSAARSALTRLLEHLLDQSSVAPTLCLRRPDRDILTLGLGRVTHPKVSSQSESPRDRVHPQLLTSDL